MGGIACLAAEKGYHVTGSDENIYPPMSTQLEKLGIRSQERYLPEHLQPHPDKVIIGNALKRGNPAVEYVLNAGIPYQSGPAWLADHLLNDKWTIAVAGTHGKTTTSSMIAWILEWAGKAPGFLIGGIPTNFGLSAKAGKGPFFVVEADEYDSAFFDKRSKFVHYHPTTCVLNNLEFDHADIFDSLSDIQKQFHHLVRTIPGKGQIIVPSDDQAIQEVLAWGKWSEVRTFGKGGEWEAQWVEQDGSVFKVFHQNKYQATLTWSLIGQHNVHNALAAIAAVHHVGVSAEHAIEALNQFRSVKRRMEIRGQVKGITVYDDFAHHPTAIQSTIEGLRARIGEQRLLAVVDIRSNTMRMGVHQDQLTQALEKANETFLYQPPTLMWSVSAAVSSLGTRAHVFQSVDPLIDTLAKKAQSGDHVLVMSNGGFDNLHERLLNKIAQEEYTQTI